MSGEERTPIATLAAPYRREVRLEAITFESGMKMLRVIVREGHRITQLDLDPATARAWAEAMTGWADTAEAAGEPADVSSAGE